MRWTAERIGLSDMFFLRRSSEKRYEFIRYTETYQFSQLLARLYPCPLMRDKVSLSQGNVVWKKKKEARRRNFVETLNTETVQPTSVGGKGGRK